MTEGDLKKRQAEEVEEAVESIQEGHGICTNEPCDLCDGLEWNIGGEGEGLFPPKEVEHELERDAVTTAMVDQDVLNPELDVDRDANQVDNELEQLLEEAQRISHIKQKVLQPAMCVEVGLTLHLKAAEGHGNVHGQRDRA